MATKNGGDFDYKAFRKDWDALLERQKYKEAEKLCHEGLSKSPLDQSRGRLYNHLGYLYENFLDDKTFDDILEHYVLSLQVDESNANSHYNLANFLLEQGMQHLLRALELNPSHGKANKRYANLTPIKANTTLDLSGHKYQVVEVVEDGVRAIRLRKRADGGYERVDEEAMFVEVGPAEKVYGSSKGNRTNNMANGDDSGRVPLEVHSGYNGGNGGGSGGNGCCNKCVLYWWFWALCWILAVGGVVVPVLGYLIFAEEECVDKVSTESVALNTNEATQGNLNILFVVDCGASNWNDQFTAANDLLSDLNDGGIMVSYDIMQYCNDGIEGVIIDGNMTTDFMEYTSDTTIQPIEQFEAEGIEDSYVSGAFKACQETYDDEDSTPFLCIPFISQRFMDTFDAMTITSQTEFAEIYLAFMVDDSATNFDPEIYPVLGSFATGTECIARLDDESAFGNTWWSAKLTCNAAEEQATCSHCISYGNDSSLECAADELSNIFDENGVEETRITSDTEQECKTTYTAYYFYSIGGVVPLLIWVMIVIFVLCCNSCRNGNKRNMEAHNGLNNEPKQTAFV